MFSKIAAVCFAAFCLLPGAIHGEMPLDEYLREERLELYWDDLTARGIIWRGDEMVSFLLDFPAIMQNFEEPVAAEPIFYSGGALMLPESTRDQLDGIFRRDSGIEYREVSKIFIDPGHGGRDPGTVGTLASGDPIYEKSIVLDVALDLAEMLRQSYPDKEIILSRDTDVYLTLEQRTEMANSLSSGPDEKILFVSIHANAALNSRASGIEVWYLPPEHRRQVLNAEDIDQDSSTVLPILNSILEEEYTVESILLAQSIDRGMMREIGGFTQSRGLKEMDWYVVRKAFMPSVLVEVGFVTNAEEVELLNNPLYLQKISRGIYNGLTDFIQDFESVSQ